MKEMFFEYKSINISYGDTGKGPAIVLLHGFLENKEMWRPLVESLKNRYRIITIDLLGHGKSDSLGYIHTMEEQAELVHAVLRQLRLRKYVLIGHSMGGYISLAYSKKYPLTLRGLCLMNSTALADSAEKKINRERAIIAVQQSHATFIRLSIPMLFSEENRTVFTNEIAEITQEALAMNPRGIVAALEGMKIRSDHSKIYTTATFPIQLIVGKKDPVLSYQSLLKQVQQTPASIFVLPDGHMSHIENKEALIRSISLFVKQCNK